MFLPTRSNEVGFAAARAGIGKTVGPLMTHGVVLFGFLATPTSRQRKLISIKTSKAAFVIIKPRGREGPKLHFVGARKAMEVGHESQGRDAQRR
jgi:hypothetical protein